MQSQVIPIFEPHLVRYKIATPGCEEIDRRCFDIFLIAFFGASMKVPGALLACAVGLASQVTITLGACPEPPGDHVVINVRWDDPDGGLLIVDQPRNNGARIGMISSADC